MFDTADALWVMQLIYTNVTFISLGYLLFSVNLGDIISSIKDMQKDMLLVRCDFVLNINHESSIDLQFDRFNYGSFANHPPDNEKFKTSIKMN